MPTHMIDPLESRTLLSAGDPDPSFGNNGVALFTNEPASFRQVVPVAGGKVVAIGNVGNVGSNEQLPLLLARYNRNGTLDTTFSGDGYDVRSTPTTFGVDSAALQPDGKIVILGGGGGLTRLTADLQIDPSFGTGGFASVPVPGNGRISTRDVKVQPDGKIVVAGDLSDGFGTQIDKRTVVWRLHPDGSPDTTFSGDGMVVLDIMPGRGSQGLEGAESVAVLSDGRIVVGSTTVLFGPGTGWAFAAFLPDGSPDPNFGGTGGIAHVAPSTNAPLMGDMLALPDGKFLVAGTWRILQEGNPQDMMVVRFLPNGSFDPTFGTNGVARANFTPGGFGEGRWVSVWSDKIIVGGFSKETSVSNERYAAARFTRDGTLDTTFGQGGRVSLTTNPVTYATDMAVTGDNGLVFSGLGPPAALVRLQLSSRDGYRAPIRRPFAPSPRNVLALLVLGAS